MTTEAPQIENTTEGQLADAEIQALFKTVIGKIRLSVAQGELTTDSFTSILLKVVESIEELSTLNNVTGTEKRAIAINVTRLVIKDLYANGQITEDVYKMLNISVGFLAPLIFAAAKNTWKKIQDMQDDIDEHGVSGCCARNFRSKK